MHTVHSGSGSVPPVAPHVSPCPQPFNLAAYVLASAAQTPEKMALQIVRPSGAERWSFGRLEAAVRGTATGLLQLDLPPGAKILLRLGNGPEFPVAFLGAIAAGYVPVPTSAQLTEAEISKMAASLRPDLVIAGDGIALPQGGLPSLNLTELRAMSALPPAEYAMGDPERLAYMVYTSGTSGQPRAVMHAHRAIWARRMMVEGWYGLRESDRILHAGAFNWTYTLGTGLLDPWSIGATALIPHPSVEPRMIPLLLKRFDATIFAAAPGVYRQILKHHTKIDAPKLRHGLSAGEAMSPSLSAAWQEASGTLVHQALGMSECSTFLSGAPARPAPTGTIGWPQAGRKLGVKLESGEIVPLEATANPITGDPITGDPITGVPITGELMIHRADQGMFLGYYGAAEESAARFDGDWFCTGDMIAREAETGAETGAVRYLGRADDLMNAGGFRVSPLEVEAVLGALPEAGDVAALVLEVKPEVSVIALAYTGAAEIAAFEALAARDLARYKQPRAYLRQDTLPRNANGKLDRRALARALATALYTPT